MQHIHPVPITFGDCDPAGIVFYPNTFRWMDACFHSFLRGFGGHADICATLGAVGVGLVDSGAQFRSPMRDGDALQVHLDITDWGRKTLTARYEGRIGDRLAFAGQEVRALFTPGQAGLVAGDMTALRSLLDARAHG